MQQKPFTPDGPIPGENYTSDTRNYPWHRPPEITDLDKGVEVAIKHLTKPDQATILMTMLEAGVTVVQATDIFLSSGLAKGKWTLDYALLLAGPVSHIIKLMAETYEVKYDMGLKDKPLSTINFVKAKHKDPAKVVDIADEIMDQKDEITQKAEQQPTPEAPEQGAGGFMGMPATPEEVM